jgi:pseudolysin/vibriolysin
MAANVLAVADDRRYITIEEISMNDTSWMKRSPLYLTMALSLLATSVSAATRQQVESMRPTSLSAVTAANLAEHLNLDKSSELQVVRSAPTAHGTTTVRMQQMSRGLPVFGAVVTVETDDRGTVIKKHGEVFTGLNADLPAIKPGLTEAQARALWRKQSGVSATAQVEARDANLLIYPQETGKARLVYQLSHFVGGDHPSRPTAIIDADTGEIIQHWEGLAHAEAAGPGGNQKTGQYFYGSDGRPSLNVTQAGTYCTTETNQVATYHLRNSTNVNGGAVWRFLCPNSRGDAVNGAFGPINDAHHFGTVTFDMYRAYLNAAPLKNRLLLKVHYGFNYENAFWDGRQMAFGDGRSVFYPLVGLDVVAHEVSHGFTEQNSGLIYAGQSGGMNEAFSDIAGDAAEWFDRKQSDQWVGADIFKAQNAAMRYMCEPTRDGRSIDHLSKYRAGIDVHFSSGIYNKAYCTLVKRPGWDPEKAFKTFARANAMYWIPNETFVHGACDVQRAAGDLDFNEADVIAAFNAVGISCKP